MCSPFCGDDLDVTIDSSSGSVPYGLCEGSVLRAALVFVSIVLKAEPESYIEPTVVIF